MHRFSTLSTAAAVVVLATAAHPASAQSATFNFANDLGTPTTFTDTVNGISATFSSPDDPNIFVVESSFYQSMVGNVLGPGPGVSSVPLDIALSAPMNSLSFGFGLNGFDTSSLTVTAFSGGLNGKEVGSKTVTGAIPGGEFQFPEGSLSFADSTSFDTVEVTSNADSFAIGNIQVGAVPETSTATSLGLLLALGLGAAWFARRRRACVR